MPKNTKAVLNIDVKSILDHFADLPDPRSHINRGRLSGDLVVVCIMAVIAGAEGPKAIGLWARSNESWLKERLQLPGGMPAHDTPGETHKGHGRTEVITYFQMPVPAGLLGRHQREGLRTLGVAIQTSTQANKTTHDVRYSTSSPRTSITQFTACVHGQWSIENTLHWCLNVSLPGGRGSRPQPHLG